MASPTKVAVVTGANKGIGFGIVRALLQHPYDGIVYLTARDTTRGEAALEELAKSGLTARFHQLDIDSLESIQAFRDFIKTEHGGLDVLVNNAAIAFKHAATDPFGYQAQETIRVNYFGTLNVCHELFPLLRPGARVVQVSSSLGHLSQINGQSPGDAELRKQLSSDDLTEEKLGDLMNTFIRLAKEGTHHSAGWPNSTYNVSKVGLSALTRIQQREIDATRPCQDILINSCHPGYVNTDMTSHQGPLSIAEGAVAPTWLALLPPNYPLRGGYVWYDKRIVDWVNGPT